MSAGKHTLGPWHVDEDTRPGMQWNRHICSDAGTTICFMAHSDGKDEQGDEAKARLIAAAPEMLGMLQWCESWFSKHSPTATLINGQTGEHPMLGIIREVIAKASKENP